MLRLIAWPLQRILRIHSQLPPDHPSFLLPPSLPQPHNLYAACMLLLLVLLLMMIKKMMIRRLLR